MSTILGSGVVWVLPLAFEIYLPARAPASRRPPPPSSKGPCGWPGQAGCATWEPRSFIVSAFSCKQRREGRASPGGGVFYGQHSGGWLPPICGLARVRRHEECSRRIPFSALLARPPVQLASDQSPVPCSVFLHKPDHRGVLFGRPLPHGALLAVLLAPSHVVVRVHVGAEPFLCGDSLRILKDRWLDGWSGGVSVCRHAPAATAAAASLLPARRMHSTSAVVQPSGQSDRSNRNGSQSEREYPNMGLRDWSSRLTVEQAVGTFDRLRRVPLRGEISRWCSKDRPKSSVAAQANALTSSASACVLRRPLSFLLWLQGRFL